MSRRPSEPRPGSGQQPPTSAAIQLSVSTGEFVALGQTQNSRPPQGIGYGGQAGMGFAGQQGSSTVYGSQGYHGQPGISQQQGAQRGDGSGYWTQGGDSYGSWAQAAGSYGSPAQAGGNYGSLAQAAGSYGSPAQAAGSYGSPAQAGPSYGAGPYRAQSGGGSVSRPYQSGGGSVSRRYGGQSGGGRRVSNKKQQYDKKVEDDKQRSLDIQKHVKNNPKTYKGQLAMKIRVPPHVEATNLEFMFKNSTDREKIGEFGFVDFETSLEAVLAKGEWDKVQKISKDGTTKEPAYEITLIPLTAVEESKREAHAAAPKVQGTGIVRKTRIHWYHNSLQTGEFDWCTVEELSCKENKAFVKPFKFEVASKHGSVSPDLVLCEGTDTGNVVFSSVLSFLFQQHIAGRTYKGNVKLDHLVVSQKLMLCAILQETCELKDLLDAQADVDSVINSLLPLYRISGKLPPYYDCMVERSKHAPYTIIPREMELFQKEMLDECCFAPFELRVFLVQESHIINKNLHPDSKEDFNKSAPRHLEDWTIIHQVDRLMNEVVIGGTSTGCNFAHEGSHMRQIVDHAPEHIDKKPKVHLPLKERDMLIYYYVDVYSMYDEEEEGTWDWDAIEREQLAEAELEEDTREPIEGEQLAEAELVEDAEDTREAIQEEQQADEAKGASKEAKDGNSPDHQAGAETHDGVEDAYH